MSEDKEFLNSLFKRFSKEERSALGRFHTQSEERAVALREAAIGQESHQNEIARLQRLLRESHDETIRLREMVRSVQLSHEERRKAVKMAILPFPLVADSVLELADAIDSEDATEILTRFATIMAIAFTEIRDALNLDRTEH